MLLRHSSALFARSVTRQRNHSTRNILKLKERSMYDDIFPNTSIKQVTDLLNASPQTVYAGFDPTADSLHIGNLLVLINLLHWQRGGHKAIAIIGGATAKIGDPSGKTSERDELTKAFVDENVKGVRRDLVNVFENHRKCFCGDASELQPLIIVNNEDWYGKMSAIELMGGVARHLRMGDLLSRKSVHSRLASPVGMSFAEFSYQLFQAYDWLHLFREYGCKFQIGGSDQMGNITSGYDLIGKLCRVTVHGLTVPLVTTEMGDKFGKSAGNAVWLSAHKTSPFTLYQFFVRIPDSDAEKMLKLFTFDTLGEIFDLIRRHESKPELRLAQKRLAEQVTLLVHGEEGLKSAQNATKALYEGSVAGLGEMRAEEIAQLFQGATVVEVLPQPGQNLVDVAMKAGCFATVQDAVRIISAGGFYVNQQKAMNPSEVLNLNAHRLANNVSLFRVGKRNYYIVKWLS